MKRSELVTLSGRSEAEARAFDGVIRSGEHIEDLEEQMRALVHHLGNDMQIAISALRLMTVRLPQAVLVEVDPFLNIAVDSLQRAGERRRKILGAQSSAKMAVRARRPSEST